jgi:hypothetical protein
MRLDLGRGCRRGERRGEGVIGQIVPGRHEDGGGILVPQGLDGVGLRVAIEEGEDGVVLVVARVGAGVMESVTDAVTMDPATDALATESASSSRADSSLTYASRDGPTRMGRATGWGGLRRGR